MLNLLLFGVISNPVVVGGFSEGMTLHEGVTLLLKLRDGMVEANLDDPVEGVSTHINQKQASELNNYQLRSLCYRRGFSQAFQMPRKIVVELPS